jgi:hypothetical protein
VRAATATRGGQYAAGVTPVVTLETVEAIEPVGGDGTGAMPTAPPRTGAVDRSVQTVDAHHLRAAGAAMLGIAAIRPLLPVGLGPPCPLRTLTGIPCPFCGMTRSVTAVVHGHLGASLALNPAGIVAVLLAIALLLAWRVRRITYATWLVPLVLGLMWSYQLFKYATGRPL